LRVRQLTLSFALPLPLPLWFLIFFFFPQNKEFIFRGFELERLADFSQRIQAKFSDAKMLTYTDPPPEETLQSDTQSTLTTKAKNPFAYLHCTYRFYCCLDLQIFSVKASFVEEKEGKPHPRVKKEMSAGMQKYYSLNEVDVFLYSKPFRKNKKKGEQPHEEFAVRHHSTPAII